MWCEFLTRNTRDKIIAVCAGSAACSLVLLLAWLLRIPERTGAVTLDDSLFGARRPWFWVSYMADVSLQLTTVRLLQGERWRIGLALGTAWTAVLLSETLFDLPVFAHDPHMFCEEVAFFFIYLYLLALLISDWCLSSSPPRGRGVGRTTR